MNKNIINILCGILCMIIGLSGNFKAINLFDTFLFSIIFMVGLIFFLTWVYDKKKYGKKNRGRK